MFIGGDEKNWEQLNYLRNLITSKCHQTYHRDMGSPILADIQVVVGMAHLHKPHEQYDIPPRVWHRSPPHKDHGKHKLDNQMHPDYNRVGMRGRNSWQGIQVVPVCWGKSY